MAATQADPAKRPTATGGEVRFTGSPQNLALANISTAYQFHRWAFMLFRVKWSTAGGPDGSFAYINGNGGSTNQRQPMLTYTRTGSLVGPQWRNAAGMNQIDLAAAGDDAWHTLVTRLVGGVHYASIDGGAEASTGAGITMAQNVGSAGLIGDFRTTLLDWGLDTLLIGQGDLDPADVARLHGWGLHRRGVA